METPFESYEKKVLPHMWNLTCKVKYLPGSPKYTTSWCHVRPPITKLVCHIIWTFPKPHLWKCWFVACWVTVEHWPFRKDKCYCGANNSPTLVSCPLYSVFDLTLIGSFGISPRAQVVRTWRHHPSGYCGFNLCIEYDQISFYP